MGYKILFVDDEDFVRKSIIKKVPWEELGFEVVDDAENGEQALIKLENLDVDILLTDIKMPFMDGITLANKVKSIRNSIEIVLFSGFNEFEYAKEAINIGVAEYILKPIDIEDLSKTLKKIKIKLDKKLEDKRNVELLRLKYNESLPILKEHYLHQLVNGKLNSEEILKGIETYNFSFGYGKKWVVSSIMIKIPKDTKRNDLISLHKAKELIPISVLGLIDDTLNDFCSYSAYESTIGINLISAIDDISITDYVNVLNNLCKDCKKNLDITITIGIGEGVLSLFGLYKSYEQSKDALGYREIIGNGNAIYIRDVEPLFNIELDFDEQLEGKLLSAIKFYGEKEIEEVVEEIINKLILSNIHTSQRQVYIISILNSLLRTMQKYNVYSLKYNFFEHIQNLNTSNDIKLWLLEICNHINKNIDTERNNNNQNLIKNAKQYINENFQNAELSVDMVCNYLHLSEAYFSTMFKKETGTSYINYLTQLRMTKALELLNKSDSKIHIIATECGYQSANYFSYAFKKYYGYSPSKYKEEH
ncbi:MAG: response regulator [Lachnospirales bacterium]